MKAPDSVVLKADLRRCLQGRLTFYSPEISEVIVGLSRFISAILSDGFHVPTARAAADHKVRSVRPFIEACYEIIEHHVRIMKSADRALVGKSLLEAYICAAGPQYVLEPPRKTRFMHSLRRRGVKGFLGLFLSLHVFNLVSLEIQDDVRTRVRDLKSFELYMLRIEEICIDIVTRAIKIPGSELDVRWAAAVCHHIEGQLSNCSDT